MDNQMDAIMGIGPKIELSSEIKKTLRVGTVKQLKDVGELYRGEKDGITRPKFAVYKGDEAEISRWVEILNIIVIEGFTREEFDDSIPEQMESAVERFLFG